MRRQRDDMQVNVAGLRRNIKNLAHNYSDAQVKVREATSNDPWGPSSTLMSEIADLTYNVVAFTEIMQMIWKRLNDHGKNWRHVYKALVLLEYLIKTGTEKVAQQCKENIFAIQTLKDFQYLEETKDQGLNVREKAKQLVSLLKDDERLRNERARALKAKERFAQAASGFGSDGMFQGQWSSSDSEPPSRELETARPQTVGEEELQLQLALAMSREEADQEEQRRRSDDVRLQLALSQSEQEFKHHLPGHADLERPSHMLDLLDVDLGSPSSQPRAAHDPWGLPQRPQNDPWSSPAAAALPSTHTLHTLSASPIVDPWAPVLPEPPLHAASPDQWRATSPRTAPAQLPASDPWSPSTNTDHSSPASLDEFEALGSRERPPLADANTLNNNGGGLTPDPFDLSLLGDGLEGQPSAKKTPHSFLGENSALVNLDNLVTVSARPAPAAPVPAAVPLVPTANPFATAGAGAAATTAGAGAAATTAGAALFQPAPARPTLGQMRQQPFTSGGQAAGAWGAPQPNPFLS
ncbi:epsin-2 isoform X2 [Bacillus rossius redtenbacheri]|uniref:epsin-2 isoform X2 n=1 Tax=Bacillus rossius redtenbacheri TaxID=93214 RepID=UPI002FDD9745